MKNTFALACFILTFTISVVGCSKADGKNMEVAASGSATNAQSYKADSRKSAVEWKGSNLMGTNTHNGFVYLSKGELLIDNGQITGGLVVIDMNTLEDETRSRKNNLIDRLKDPDFFDVAKFPVSSFTFTKTTVSGKENIWVTGNLTIKGITNTVTFPAKLQVKDSIARLSGTLAIDRTLWDIRYKSGKFYELVADQTISDSIEFSIGITAKK